MSAKDNRHSETLEPELKKIVQAIRARHGAAFRTQAFLPAHATASQSGIIWREAWLNPATGMWVVENYETVPGFCVTENPEAAMKIHKKKKTVLADACFFDALYACAEFEFFEKKNGNRIQEQMPGFADKTHFRTFAQGEGIPFDGMGMPLAAAFGRILTDGAFDDEAENVAKASAGNMVPVAVAKPESALCDVFSVPAVWGKQDGLALPQIKVEDYIKIKALAKQADVLTDAFNNVSDRAFVRVKDPYFLTGTTLMTAGIIPLLFYCRGESWLFPVRKFNVELRKYRDQLKKLPEHALKAAFEQFAKDVELGFHILDAQASFLDALDGERSQRAVARKLRKLDKAAGRLGYAPQEIETLKKKVYNSRDSGFKSDIRGRLSSKLWEIRSAANELAP